MEIEFSQEVSRMDELKIQAMVLIPVLRAARAELGEEHGNRLVLDALRVFRREYFQQLGDSLPGSPLEKWNAINSRAMGRVRADQLESVRLRKDAEAFDLDVRRCKFAEFFREQGEPDLGAALVCECDQQLADIVGSPELELTRTQTLMQGGCCCDFRFRMNSSSPQE